MALENKRVGENIKRRREELNYTQQSVADKVGVTKQTVCKIEKTGSTNPRTLARIAEALRVDVQEFYKPTQEKSKQLGYPDFITDEDKKIIIYTCRPVMKSINDTIAKNIYDKIMDKYRAGQPKIQSVLKDNGFTSKNYTHEQMVEACKRLYVEIFSDIIGIFKDSENGDKPESVFES